MAIPKIIHYAWFSADPMDKLYKECFRSWHEKLTDYRIQLWDKSRHVHSPFFNKMIRQRKWAFASDYIRLYALYHYGGIYLDLDVRVLRNFDSLLHHDCIWGREDAASLACHFIAAAKRHPFIKECLAYYDNSLRLKISPPPTMPRIISRLTRRNGLQNSDSIQTLAGNIIVYPSKYFSPFHYRQLGDPDPDKHISDQSYCIHYWKHGWSWLDKSLIVQIKNQPWLFMNPDDWIRFIRQVKKRILLASITFVKITFRGKI